MRVRELAEALGTDWEGDGGVVLTGVAPVEVAGPAELSFVAGPKGAAAAARSQAGCLIAAPGFEASGRSVIRSADPRGTFARAVGLFYPPEPVCAAIHPTAVIDASAIVDPSAEIGPHVTIGRASVIGPNTRIGAGCAIGARVRIGPGGLLHANVTVYADVTIGERAVLHSGCVIGADGFGFVLEGGRYAKFPQVGRVEIGDSVEIGANSCVDRAALGVTAIGDGTTLDNMVHVGHNCRIGRHVVIAAQTGISGGVEIGDHAVIGGQVGIGDKARIEAGAVLGSGSGVLTSKIVRSGQVLWGTPARPLKEHLEQLANMGRVGELRERITRIERELARTSVAVDRGGVQDPERGQE